MEILIIKLMWKFSQRVFQSLTTKFVKADQNLFAEKHFTDLKSAIKELSAAGEALEPNRRTLGNGTNISKFETLPMEDLTTEQLEDLAQAHFEGTLQTSDPSRAVQLWERAAERGSLGASYSLAVCYREGKGLEKNVEKAFSLLENLSKQNYHLAHYALGLILTSGDGPVAKDEERAFHSFKAAAKSGVLPALHNIANCYAGGRGVKQSDHNALLYYEAAAEAGDPSAKFTLGTWIYQGRGGKQDRTRAFLLQLDAAQMGHPGAMFNAGAHYMSGIGVERDFSKAAEWFRMAESAGIVKAAINLANMFRQGVGVQRDLQESRVLLQKHATHSQECRTLLADVDEEIAKLR